MYLFCAYSTQKTLPDICFLNLILKRFYSYAPTIRARQKRDSCQRQL